MRKHLLIFFCLFSTFMFRTGLNVEASRKGSETKRFLEPSLMVYRFRSATALEDYPSVVATNYLGGEELVISSGLNYHLLPGKVKLGLHYVATSGDRGELPADGRLSLHHSQEGIGGIQRGNYIGMEVVLNY
ncbi:MAG: hypothetical protein ACJAZ9_000845 [Neolewinella sp.]|jgi:hypothetical protein